MYLIEMIETSCLNKSLVLKWFYRLEREKNYWIWFLPTTGVSSCGISQGEIISVNWLLCYRFFQRFLDQSGQQRTTTTITTGFANKNRSLEPFLANSGHNNIIYYKLSLKIYNMYHMIVPNKLFYSYSFTLYINKESIL